MGRQAQDIADVNSANDQDDGVTFHQVTSTWGFSHCNLKVETATALVTLLDVDQLNIQYLGDLQEAKAEDAYETELLRAR